MARTYAQVLVEGASEEASLTVTGVNMEARSASTQVYTDRLNKGNKTKEEKKTNGNKVKSAWERKQGRHSAQNYAKRAAGEAERAALPTRTPASSKMYKMASQGVKYICKKRTLGVMRAECATGSKPPPTYFDLEWQQRARRKESFEHICHAVDYLEVYKFSAADYVSSPYHRERWDSWISLMMDMALQSPLIYQHMENYYDSLMTVGLTTVFVRNIMKHRIEALLELQPREPAVDDWLQHQIRVCDEWFEWNETSLLLLPDKREQLRVRWVECLWHQWEKFLRNGFDAVFAGVWEPRIAGIVLGHVRSYFSFGQYPEEDEFRPHWLETDQAVGLYDNDIMVVQINGDNYMKPEGADGDIVSSIPPEYRPKDQRDERTNMKDVISYVLEGMAHPKRGEWYDGLKRKILRSDLDVVTVEAIDIWAKRNGLTTKQS